MSTLLSTVVRHDVRLQYRYGIYAAYGFVVAIYITILTLAGPYLPHWVPAALIFTDPAALGFFFLGALMMLEKAEGVRLALAVTPVTAAAYLAGKTITLTGMALLACAALMPVMGHVTDPALLLAAVALTSIQYVGIGVPIALRFRTVNGYLIGSAGFLTPLIAPGFLALLDPMPIWLAVLPAISQFRLFLVATGAATAEPAEIAFMLAICAAAAGGGLWLALRFLKPEIGK